jgi:hypothetical protein
VESLSLENGKTRHGFFGKSHARRRSNRHFHFQMKPSPQTALPFSTAPIDWTLPLEFQFNQLRAVSDAARRHGFRIFRLKVIPGGYEAQFQRDASAKQRPVDPVQNL